MGSAVLLLSLLMRREESSSAQDRLQQEYLPSMLILQTVGSTSCVLEEYQESMAVLRVQSLMLGQAVVLMGSALIQMRFQSVRIIMEILSSHPVSLLGTVLTPDARRTQR